MIESPHLHPLYYISCIVPCSLRPIVFCKQNASCRRLPLVSCKNLLPPQKSQRFLFTSQSSAVRPEIWLQLFYIAKVFFILGFIIFLGKTLLPKIYFWCSVFFYTHQYSFVFIRATQSLILCIIEYYVFSYALYSSRLCRNYQYSGTKVWRQKFWCAKKIDFWKDSAPVSLLSNVRPEFFLDSSARFVH